MFPINNVLKQGDVLSSLLFNFALEYAIMRVEVSQDGLKLNGTHPLFYANDASVLGRNMHTLKKNTEVSVFASKEIGLDVNANKTKYMFMSRYLNTRRSHKVNIDNNSFEKVEYFQ